MGITRNERRTLRVTAGSNTAQEIDHLLGLVAVGIVKVESIFRFFDIESILVGAGFQNELLKVQESTLMRHLLPNLNTCTEGMVRETFRAICEFLLDLHQRSGEAATIRKNSKLKRRVSHRYTADCELCTQPRTLVGRWCPRRPPVGS